MSKLTTPVGALHGVGDALRERLERLGIKTAQDLLLHLPFRWEDYSQVIKIRNMQPGPVTVGGTVEQVASRYAKTRRLHITEAVISDGTGTLKAVWFNQPYLKAKLVPGTGVVLAGKLEFRNSDLALQSPVIEYSSDLAEGKIIPVYPETQGITSRQIAGLVEQVIDSADQLPDPLPPEIIQAQKLPVLGEAIRILHQPKTTKGLEQAKRRMAFEELFFVIACGLVIKNEIMTEPAHPIEFKKEVADQFIGQLGFKLTDAQRAAAWQLLQDLEKPSPMNRLLEGDVGSGKTVVAALASVMVMEASYQVALMVPTEVLARQHHKNLSRLLEPLGHKVGLLLGGMPTAERKVVSAQLASGAIKIVIGTNALLTGDVGFQSLGLVIIDEQHRFGVKQRQLLKAKAGYLPHLLTMTATPIPRTLALAIYGDLDISVIDSLPPGRKPVITRVSIEATRMEVYRQVDAEIAAGRQVYVVCPLINDSDVLGVKSVTAEVNRLQKGPFAHRPIAVIHGRMKADEKASIMDQFGSGQLDILVATSLIEVGVDVPNATVMIIEAAERYGLATLHQLRGRVGRSNHQSYCYLFASRPDIPGRLSALERTNDGFRLAQIDMEMRGAGQIYGLRQHGRLDLRFANINDTKLLAEARQAATDFVGDPAAMLKYKLAMQRINQLKEVTSLD